MNAINVKAEDYNLHKTSTIDFNLLMVCVLLVTRFLLFRSLIHRISSSFGRSLYVINDEHIGGWGCEGGDKVSWSIFAGKRMSERATSERLSHAYKQVVSERKSCFDIRNS